MPDTTTRPTAAHGKTASTSCRKSGTLVITAVSPRERSEGPVAELGCCRATLKVGHCAVEADDARLLGVAAWVLDAGSVEVRLSTLTERSFIVQSKAPFQSIAVERRRASSALPVRDEAWFLVRFARAFHGVSCAGGDPQTGTTAWDDSDLVRSLALIPAQFHVNSRLPRVAKRGGHGAPIPPTSPMPPAVPPRSSATLQVRGRHPK